MTDDRKRQTPLTVYLPRALWERLVDSANAQGLTGADYASALLTRALRDAKNPD